MHGPWIAVWLKDSDDSVDDEEKNIDYTYTVIASKDDRSASLNGLDIDEQWYRENNEIPAQTVICNIDLGTCSIGNLPQPSEDASRGCACSLAAGKREEKQVMLPLVFLIILFACLFPFRRRH